MFYLAFEHADNVLFIVIVVEIQLDINEELESTMWNVF